MVYTTEEALAWCLQIVEGLAYLHAQRPVIVHRDLKLENCLLTGASHNEADGFGPAPRAEDALVAPQDVVAARPHAWTRLWGVNPGLWNYPV